MIDDSEPPPPADREALLYDYFKWITTLALLVIGGALSMTQAAGLKLAGDDMVRMLGPLCVAGVTGLSGADGIVRRRLSGKAARIRPSWLMTVATVALGAGVGVFLALFWSTLK